MGCDWDSPLFRRRRREQTEAERLAERELRKAGSSPFRVPDPHPYVAVKTVSGKPGIEIGIKGTF